MTAGEPQSETEVVFLDDRVSNASTRSDEGKAEPGRCAWFDGIEMASGYNLVGTAAGPILISNIFLSTALIYLASEEAGCLEPEDPSDPESNLVEVDDCQERVFGVFRPASLITNIAVVTGVIAALFMPVAGAIIDYTAHRWTTGVVAAVLITMVQIIQIGTGSKTWFIMAVLQAITGFFYQVEAMTNFAYLPDIACQVDQETMTRFTSTFTMVQFTSQAIFLLLVVVVSTLFSTNDVITACLSQAINSVNIIISFTLAWRLLPKVPARHVLEEGKSLIWQGFVQNWNTAKRINRDYKRSLRWFLLGFLVAEPAANAFTVASVVFLSEKLKMSANEIGIFFFVTIVAMVPGGKICHVLALRTNANTSLRFSMFMIFVLAIIGALVLTPDNVSPVAYIWGVCVGLMLGCYYPSQALFLSLVIPHGQEAELSGLFVYCTQILSWLPPLMFSLLVEAGVDQGIGLICVGCIFLVAIVVFSMAAPFEELLEEIHGSTTSSSSEGKGEVSLEEESTERQSAVPAE